MLPIIIETMMKGYITIKRAAEILGVSIETLRNWDRKGKLVASRDKSNGYRFYKISELEAFAEQNNKINQRRHTKFKLTGDN